MPKGKKLMYDSVIGALVVISMISAIGLFYSHLRLGQLDSPAGQMTAAFSDSAQEEYETMENIRIVSGVALTVSLVVLAAVFSEHYQLTDDPEWEMKKEAVGGVFVAIVGGGVYYYGSDLSEESVGLALVLVGICFSLIPLYFLSTSEFATDSTANPDSHCANCGTNVLKTNNYCPNCGLKL